MATKHEVALVAGLNPTPYRHELTTAMHHLCPRSEGTPSFKRIRGMSSPGGILNALATHARVDTHSAYIHRLRLGLLGYLIPFASPSFSSSQCPVSAQQSVSPLVVLSDLYAFHRSTRKFPLPLPYSQLGSFHRLSRIRHCFFSGKRSSRPVGLLPPRGIAPSGFRPCGKFPTAGSVGVWAVSQH
ncbi:UNVERIFIED_CONTAM: hypothetical protein Sindi_3059900 [Sesamum indicum]